MTESFADFILFMMGFLVILTGAMVYAGNVIPGDFVHLMYEMHINMSGDMID